MNKLEAKFTTVFLKDIRYTNTLGSYPAEVKVARGNRLNYKSEIKPHQTTSLSIAKNNVLAYKISDLDQLQKPFDIIVYDHSPAYFIINFNYPSDKEYFIIDVQSIKDEMEIGHKSLWKDRARLICIKSGFVV